MDLSHLPNSWLMLFVSTLPCPLKRTVRQCNRGLQQLVDSTSNLQLDLRDGYNATAVALCSKHLVTLHVPGSLHQESVRQLAQQITALGGLPSLQKLSCGILQPDIIAAIASSSRQLSSLRICSAGTYQAGGPEYWHQFMRKLCVLRDAQSLRNLEVDNLAADTGLPAELTARQSSFVGTLTQLASLTLTRHCGVTYSPSDAAEAFWTAAVSPLVKLTSLSLCGQLAVPTGAEGLPNLRQLSCVFKRVSLGSLSIGDPGSQGGSAYQDYQWLAKCSNLTELRLHCCISQVDFAAIAALKQLRSLTLAYSASEKLYCTQLQPLTACKHLTALEVDGFVFTAQPNQMTDRVNNIERPASDHSSIRSPLTTAADNRTADATATNHHQQQQQQQQLDGIQHVQLCNSSNSNSSSSMTSSKSHWQLASLKKLSVGNIGVATFHAPVSSMAPNLTELRDSVEPDAASKKWTPDSVRALSGLRNLQVLWLDITCLIDHLTRSSSVAASLTALSELHIEMVGYMDKPEVRGSGGLWRLPALQLLELYTNDYDSEDWIDTYLSAEDVLIWQSQSSVQTLVLRGSSRLGGFLEHDDLLAMMPLKLPNLRKFELHGCRDLFLPQVVRLLGACSPRCSVVVRGRHGMSAQECRDAWHAAAAAGCGLEFL